MHSPPAKYLVLIESGGSMVARLFDASRRLVTEIDGSSEEVAVMTQGLRSSGQANAPEWVAALRGHSSAERAAAQIFTLDV
jgi:hypothetical protein